MTFEHNPHRAGLYISTGSSIIFGFVIFLFGIFMITPVASWLLNAFGWVAMITGAVIFAAGLWAAVRSWA
ncbi:MAG: hypothetical protein IIC27_04650 [Chloroflexi bacterium]|nr:hypothetical protein [Chloroflexota bacterium]